MKKLTKGLIIIHIGENEVNIPKRIRPIRIWGPYIWSFMTKFGFLRIIIPEKICEPSNGGIGIILKTASMIFIWVNIIIIVVKGPRLPVVLIRIPATNANNKFAAGPANAAVGNTWQYVGTQPVPEGHVAIPSINPDTGKETVIFVRK